MNRIDCKHKHMMKSGAPPDKVLYCLLLIEFHGFTSKTEFQGLSLCAFWSYPKLFIDAVGPFNFS